MYIGSQKFRLGSAKFCGGNDPDSTPDLIKEQPSITTVKLQP